MRRTLLVPAATLCAAVLASGSCTTSKTGPSFPPGAQTIPPSFAVLSVAGLPAACTGQVYYEASTSLCPPALTYFLCDGISYTEYDCASPGSGWSQETLSQYDRVTTTPGPCSDTPTGGPGSLNGTVYVEANAGSPGENSIMVFRYCNAALPSLLVARYPTGGSGAADLDDDGILDADQQLVVNASQTLLFAVNQGSDSIAAFHIGTDGLLTPVAGSPFPSGGTAPASVGVSGNILVVANKASDGIRYLGNVAPNYTTFAIQADGSLKPTGSTFPLPLGASPTQAYVAPGGKLVFGTEESGALRALQLSATGDLTSPGSPAFLPNALFAAVDGGRPNPVWPAGLSASPTQPVLYSGVPNASIIAAFDFTATGQLSLIGEAGDPNSYLPCWSIVSADGRRLYVANAGSDNLSIWDIQTDARHPHLLQTFALPGGGNPWGLHFDPTGQLLFAITPRQIAQGFDPENGRVPIPEAAGQLLHGMSIAADGTISDVIAGSPVTLPVAPETNPFGVAVVSRP